MDGYIQGHVKRKNRDVLFRIPITIYFRTRYRKMLMIEAYSSEIDRKMLMIEAHSSEIET